MVIVRLIGEGIVSSSSSVVHYQSSLSRTGSITNPSQTKWFATNGDARSVLGEMKEDRAAQRAFPADPGRFQDISGILDKALSSDATSTLFFVLGRALVRVSISGPNRQQLPPAYAEKAQPRASRPSRP